MARRTNTRERLLATAAELFRRQGYAQTGVNEIMQQAKTTSGSFYHFFPTKEDLVLAVVDHIGESLDTEVFATDPESTADPLDRVFTVLQSYREHLVPCTSATCTNPASRSTCAAFSARLPAWQVM